MSQQNELLRQAILKILTKGKLKLFGCIIYKFDIRTTYSESCRTAYCTIDRINRKPVIMISNAFIEKELHNVRQVMYVLLHEILHFVDGHLSPVRYQGKNHYFFNLAADHIINTLLDSEAESRDALIEAPKNTYRCSEFIGKKTTLNEVYLWLLENKEHYEFEYNSVTGMIDIYRNGEYETSVPADLGEVDELGDELSEELKADIRASIRNMKCGNGSGDLFKYLEELVEVKIPWEVILENDIKKTRVRSQTNRSWKNLRKKMLHLSVTLPSHSTEETQDSLYIIKDTSGSLWNSMEDQNKFANLILQSASYFKKIKIIQHDTEIRNILELDRSNFEINREKIFELHGGGGTSHADVFRYIESQYFEEQEEIGMVILATDYYSDIEEIWNNYEFHNYVPVKVLCTTNESISPDVDPKPVYV